MSNRYHYECIHCGNQKYRDDQGIRTILACMTCDEATQFDRIDPVLVKRGSNGATYHRPNGDGKPSCIVNDGDNHDMWQEWDIDKAQAWNDSCQNPRCFGDGDDIGQKTGDVWPVKMD